MSDITQITRRGLLASLAAALAFDPERALWVSGKKLISIAKSEPRVPFRYTLVSGELPPGIKLDRNTGIISGIPTVEKWNSYLVVQIHESEERVLRSYIRL